MGLKRVKIGSLITIVDERNTMRLNNFHGINKSKNFMPTVANTDDLDEVKYKLVTKGRFVYSGMQTGRDECIRIGMYKEEEPIIVSPAYTTFEISALDEVLPEFFFMFFLSSEKDRLGAFYSDASIRSNLDWERFCDITIALPPITIQQKYVDIWLGLKNYRKSLLDSVQTAGTTYGAYMEKLRREAPHKPIGKYIQATDERNADGKFTLDNLRGISIMKKFIDTKADMEGVSLAPYKIVRPKEFAYVTVTSRNGDKISIAFNDSEDTFIVSSSYATFAVTDSEAILPEYLFMFLREESFDRYARFNSWGSARETLEFSDLGRYTIPVPPIEVQRAVVDIFTACEEHRRLAERVADVQRKICPVLIKGAVEEAEAN